MSADVRVVDVQTSFSAGLSPLLKREKELWSLTGTHVSDRLCLLVAFTGPQRHKHRSASCLTKRGKPCRAVAAICKVHVCMSTQMDKGTSQPAIGIAMLSGMV